MLDVVKGLLRQLVVTAMTALMSLIGMAVGSAVAQEATAIDGWIKICRPDPKLKKDVCQTAYEVRASSGQFLASFSIMEAPGESRRYVQLIVPTGLLLQPGLKIQVDDGKAEEGKFGFCAPDGCIAQFVPSDALVAALKKGKDLVVGAQGQSANPVSFTFPLATFKTANEGKPLDQEAFKRRQDAIAAEAAQKRQSIEEQLREAQKKAQQGQ